MLLFGVNHHRSVCVGKQFDPPCSPPPLLHGELYFCIVCIFYHWHAEHAQGLHLTLPSLQHKDFTFYLDVCSGRQGAFPVQEGVKNTQSEKSSKKLLEMEAHDNTALMSEALAESTLCRGDLGHIGRSQTALGLNFIQAICFTGSLFRNIFGAHMRQCILSTGP